MTKQEFLDTLLPAALLCQERHGIPASFTMAQAILESDWGSSGLIKQANNIFGIKADKSWRGPVFNLGTGEFLNGKEVHVAASWRKYGSWTECVEDRAQFFARMPRYAACFKEKTGFGWAEAVAKAGYATDPNYATKLSAVIRGRNLQRFDEGNAS